MNLNACCAQKPANKCGIRTCVDATTTWYDNFVRWEEGPGCNVFAGSAPVVGRMNQLAEVSYYVQWAFRKNNAPSARLSELNVCSPAIKWHVGSTH